MRLTQLRDLIAVVDSGSIRAAARSLNVAQPALSRSIRELEDELGAQLIERTVHGAVPTQAGQAFLTRARTVQSELARMREETARITGGAGAVTFGLGAQSQSVLPGALQEFRRHYPAAEIRIFGGTSETMLPLLREGRLDFAMGHVTPSLMDKHIKAYPLFRSEMLVVGRRGHPLRNAKSLKELRDADWVAFAPPFGELADGPSQLVRELIQKNTASLTRSLVRCDDTGAIANLLAKTDFIGTMSHLRLAQSPVREALEAFNVKLGFPPSLVHLYHRADSPFTPAAAAMVAAVKAEAKKIAFSRMRN